MEKVASKDGTQIAYDRFGRGPALIIVTGALADRKAAAGIAPHLADHFTVIAYDRRGRGDSGDTPPYAAEREVEDIAALIQAEGGKTFLFGHSSGAALALEAAHRLKSSVRGLAVYEPPFVVSGRPILTEEYTRRLHELLDAGRLGEAVEHFMVHATGAPKEVVAGMRSSPMWPSLEKYAHTLPYDQAVMDGTMSGRPLPEGRWSGATMPVLIMYGGDSPNMFREAADALAAILGDTKRKVLPGQNHGADPKMVAPELIDFFTK